MGPIFFKLCKIITLKDYYKNIPLSVAFTFIQGRQLTYMKSVNNFNVAHFLKTMGPISFKVCKIVTLQEYYQITPL